MRKTALVLAGWLTGLTGRGTAAPAVATAGADPYAPARHRMVAEQLERPGRDITNARVLTVMGKVPRHEFVPERLRPDAYSDHPLPIGHGQTISQPYIVAFMTEQLAPKPTDRVLEIGTGSGYQAAVLAGLVAEVYTIEIINELAARAAADLKRLRGVATWAGETLKLTVYNGTAWRVTELYVKISRFKDDDFVEDPRPVVLVPPGVSVDAGVADLLSRVAPDRKRPGLNPADTGPFEGKAGEQPENFRWEIEAARGYAPR